MDRYPEWESEGKGSCVRRIWLGLQLSSSSAAGEDGGEEKKGKVEGPAALADPQLARKDVDASPPHPSPKEEEEEEVEDRLPTHPILVVTQLLHVPS